MRFFISAVVGMLLALAVGAIVLVLASFIDAVGFYIAPAKILAPIIGPLIPSSMMYRLAPDGGAPAGILVIMICTLCFWTIVFTAVDFAWLSLRQRRKH
jgi:hypothetical protein